MIALIVIGRERGWVVGSIISASMFAIAVLLWRRQIKKSPDDPGRYHL
ncbi:hypothetical protein OK349_14975 [Sphingomonas sp. BT-65]|nr:hypothetical protein [Sphingomonas sp. BT-65]MCW4463015.1 hypothetical protein [Sphingomonas sp. BT-65]